MAFPAVVILGLMLACVAVGIYLIVTSRRPGREIVCELSHGGQGVVYQAMQISTNRKVAIQDPAG